MTPSPRQREGKTLLAIACDLAKSQLFSSVLTPNYNAGHRDHFHLDLRPDDPRFFLRCEARPRARERRSSAPSGARAKSQARPRARERRVKRALGRASEEKQPVRG